MGLVQPFTANAVTEALHFALDVACSPPQFQGNFGFPKHTPSAQVIFLNSSFIACPCFHLLIAVSWPPRVAHPCTSRTAQHMPPQPLHQTLPRTGCVWGGEMSPTRAPMSDLSIHPHQLSCFHSSPESGPSQAAAFSHTRVPRQPCSGFCQFLGKKRGWGRAGSSPNTGTKTSRRKEMGTEEKHS